MIPVFKVMFHFLACKPLFGRMFFLLFFVQPPNRKSLVDLIVQIHNWYGMVNIYINK